MNFVKNISINRKIKIAIIINQNVKNTLVKMKVKITCIGETKDFIRFEIREIAMATFPYFKVNFSKFVAVRIMLMYKSKIVIV